jgi:hypothetical protein
MPSPQLGRFGGSVVIGRGPRLRYQQLPRLPVKLSHQKSVPLGSTLPLGERPMTLSKWRL